MCCQDIKAFFVNIKEQTHRRISQANIAYLIGCKKSTLSKWNQDESRLLGAYYAPAFYKLMASPHKEESTRLDTIGISIAESDWKVAQEHYISWRKRFDERFDMELTDSGGSDSAVIDNIERDVERDLLDLEFTLHYEIENRIKHHFEKHANDEEFELNVRRDIRRRIEQDVRQKLRHRIRHVASQRITRNIRRNIAL